MSSDREEWDYRVIGINISRTNESNASKAAEKLGENFSKDFLEKEFPKEYIAKRSTNTALQCQQVIQIYGKKGWEHYQQGQLDNTAMLYFKKKKNESIKDSPEYTSSEEAIISRLDPLQRP